jgi:hypothetical protein
MFTLPRAEDFTTKQFALIGAIHLSLGEYRPSCGQRQPPWRLLVWNLKGEARPSATGSGICKDSQPSGWPAVSRVSCLLQIRVPGSWSRRFTSSLSWTSVICALSPDFLRSNGHASGRLFIDFLRRHPRHHDPRHFRIKPTNTVGADHKIGWIENVALNEI